MAFRMGAPIPEPMANAPSLLPGLALYYRAFVELSSDRSGGMGVGPVFWSSIQRYCEVLRLDEDQTEAMHSHVRAMDEAYLRHCERERKARGNG